MHCEWRLHRQFIMWCAKAVKNSQVIDDPNVSVFNVHRFFFLDVLTRVHVLNTSTLLQLFQEPRSCVSLWHF